MGVVTGLLIDRVCDRVGTSTTSPVHFSRAMVATWLSEAQRTLCAEGPILKTCFAGSSQANVEITSLPTPDFFKIVKIDLRRTNSVKKRIKPMGHIMERPVDRTTTTADVPEKYAIWAGNDASGNNAKGIIWDKNFGASNPNADPTNNPDLFIYLRQMPKTMADGGQDPEVAEVWQDALVDYGEMRARLRMAIMDGEQAKLAQIANAAWEAAKQRARDAAEPESEDEPVTVQDVAGYALDDEDTSF